MESLLASARSLVGLDRVDRAVRKLEDEWQRRGAVPLEQFWKDCEEGNSDDDEEALVLLGALIKADLRCRFERDQSPAAADYLERFPELRAADSRVISLIYEEFCLREERGEHLDVESFCGRYSAWKDSLASQLKYHRMFSQAVGLGPSKPRFPNPGDDFEEFYLQSSLGKGGTSRVFLANDRSLGGKRVVLKVSLDCGEEPKTQGALDHPHIVPINSVAFQTETDLRGLSMPYRPGLPLDELVKRVKPSLRPRRARQLWEALVSGGTPADSSSETSKDQESPRLTGPEGDGWKGFPVHGTYAQGVAWVICVLARALHYAHGKQTFHRDVKPANILLTFQHGPQLLDFNLAQSPHCAQRAESSILGGTLPYMAPEQIEAFLNPDLWDNVGAKADIYSLGLVLRELLTGQPPDLPADKLPPARAMRELLDRRALPLTPVRTFNSEIPHALEAILAKCLAFSPDDRYADAQALADDLERFLDHGSLLHAVNPSRAERLGNWSYRNRWAIVSNLCYLTVIGGLLTYVTLPYLKPAVENRPEFQEAVKAVEEGRHAEAVDPLFDLTAEYPTSPLPHLYLSFVLSQLELLSEDLPQTLYRKAMALPGAESRLISWAQTHPRLAQHLQRFGSSRLKILEQISAAANASSESAGNQRGQKEEAARNRLYEVARDAAKITLDLDPTSEQAAQDLATVEEYFGEYAAAHKRLTKLIDSVESLDEHRDRDKLIGWSIQRGRIVIRWAKELHRQQASTSTDEALRLLQAAQSDLDRCDRILPDLPDNPSGLSGNNRKLFFLLYIKTEAILARAEIERGLGKHAEADQTFHAAKKTFDRMESLARLLGSAVPRAEELKQRLQNGLRESLAERTP